MIVQRKVHPLTLPTKMVWVAIGLILLFQVASSSFSERFRIMIDDQDNRCIPEFSVYFLDKSVIKIVRGKIYGFKAAGLEPFFKDGQIIGKYAIAVAGDRIVQNEQGVWVNGQLKLVGFPIVDKLAVDEANFYKEFTLESDEVFFAGTAERSFDSRYWGVAHSDQVIGEATPLW